MAALAADRSTPYRDGELFSYKVKGGAKIFAGSIVVSDAGYSKPGVKAENLVYLGRAEEYVDNTGGADGDKSVIVRRNRAFKWDNAGGGGAITQADVGKPAYILDDQTVTDVAAGASKTGNAIILAVDSDGVWVG